MTTSAVLLLNDIILVVLLGLLWLFSRRYLGSYMEQKAKNLATKEDVAAITAKIEAVRSEFERQNDVRRAELIRIGDVNRIQFEWEFSFLRELWGKIIDILKEAHWLGIASAERAGSNSANAEAKLAKLRTALELCDEEISLHKPFFHREVYDQIASLIGMLDDLYITAVRGSEAPNKEGYWPKVDENRAKILRQVEGICEKIRERAFPEKPRI